MAGAGAAGAALVAGGSAARAGRTLQDETSTRAAAIATRTIGSRWIGLASGIIVPVSMPGRAPRSHPFLIGCAGCRGRTVSPIGTDGTRGVHALREWLGRYASLMPLRDRVELLSPPILLEKFARYALTRHKRDLPADDPAGQTRSSCA